MPIRRHAIIGLAAAWAAAAAAPLAGCGFELRQTPQMPFSALAVVGFDARSPLAADLQRALAGHVRWVEVPENADVVLHVLADSRERSVVASTAAAQVRQLQLRLRFRFRLDDAAGRELAAPTELLLARDMNYSETSALAKAQEEEQLFAAMQAEIVHQVVRRLAQVRPTRAG